MRAIDKINIPEETQKHKNIQSRSQVKIMSSNKHKRKREASSFHKI